MVRAARNGCKTLPWQVRVLVDSGWVVDRDGGWIMQTSRSLIYSTLSSRTSCCQSTACLGVILSALSTGMEKALPVGFFCRMPISFFRPFGFLGSWNYFSKEVEMSTMKLGGAMYGKVGCTSPNTLCCKKEARKIFKGRKFFQLKMPSIFTFSALCIS